MLVAWIGSKYTSLEVSPLSPSCPTVYRHGGFERSRNEFATELPNLENAEAFNLTRRHCSRTFDSQDTRLGRAGHVNPNFVAVRTKSLTVVEVRT